MSFLLWKWGGWWPSRKTWQCRLTAGRVNNHSQASQLGSVAKQLPPQSYIICKRNTSLFFCKWNTGSLGDRGLFTLMFLISSWLEWVRYESGLAVAFKLPCPERMASSNEEWIWREGEKAIWAVLRYARGIPEERRHGPVSLCGFSRGLESHQISLQSWPNSQLDLGKQGETAGLSTRGVVSSWNYPSLWSLRLQTCID